LASSLGRMTRCLDCGSERTADQCSACGLTSAAAEVMFRRRFLKRTIFFLAGSLAFPYVSQIYAPLDLDLMLVFFGVIFFIALSIAVVLDRRARNRQDLEVLKRIYAGFIPLPWILAATLFLNGKLEFTKKTDLPRYNGGRPLQHAWSCAWHATGLRPLVARGTEVRAAGGGCRRLRSFSAWRFRGRGSRAGCAWHPLVLWGVPPLRTGN